MAGMSNACYRVSIAEAHREGIVPDTVLYRKFLCEVVDKQVEATVFQSMSDQGLGPKLYFRDDEYRIEGFFHGRPLTIWEARNPRMMQLVAKAIFDYNYNQDAIDRVSAFKPMNREQLGADSGIAWAKEVVEERFPRIEGKLKDRTDEGAAYLRQVIAGVRKHFLFEGYEEFYKALLPRSGPIVLGHCDT